MSLTEQDRLDISAVVHQNYHMPTVFETVERILARPREATPPEHTVSDSTVNPGSQEKLRVTDDTCPRCLHRAHEPGACDTGSTYGCNECGPHYVNCPTCEGDGRVLEGTVSDDAVEAVVAELKHNLNPVIGRLRVADMNRDDEGVRLETERLAAAYDKAAQAALIAAGYGLRQVPDVRQIADIIMVQAIYGGHEGTGLLDEDRDSHDYDDARKAASAIRALLTKETP